MQIVNLDDNSIKALAKVQSKKGTGKADFRKLLGELFEDDATVGVFGRAISSLIAKNTPNATSSTQAVDMFIKKTKETLGLPIEIDTTGTIKRADRKKFLELLFNKTKVLYEALRGNLSRDVVSLKTFVNAKNLDEMKEIWPIVDKKLTGAAIDKLDTEERKKFARNINLLFQSDMQYFKNLRFSRTVSVIYLTPEGKKEEMKLDTEDYSLVPADIMDMAEENPKQIRNIEADGDKAFGKGVLDHETKKLNEFFRKNKNASPQEINVDFKLSPFLEKLASAKLDLDFKFEINVNYEAVSGITSDKFFNLMMDAKSNKNAVKNDLPSFLPTVQGKKLTYVYSNGNFNAAFYSLFSNHFTTKEDLRNWINKESAFPRSEDQIFGFRTQESVIDEDKTARRRGKLEGLGAFSPEDRKRVRFTGTGEEVEVSDEESSRRQRERAVVRKPADEALSGTRLRNLTLNQKELQDQAYDERLLSIFTREKTSGSKKLIAFDSSEFDDKFIRLYSASKEYLAKDGDKLYIQTEDSLQDANKSFEKRLSREIQRKYKDEIPEKYEDFIEEDGDSPLDFRLVEPDIELVRSLFGLDKRIYGILGDAIKPAGKTIHNLKVTDMKGFVQSMVSIVDFYVGGVREKGEKILDTITASGSGESLEGTPPIEEQVDTFLDDLAEGASKIKKELLSNFEPHVTRSLKQKSMNSILTRNSKLREILTSNGIIRIKDLDVEE